MFLLVLSACKLDPVRDVWEYYEDWRNENNAWLSAAGGAHKCRRHTLLSEGGTGV